MAGAGQWKTSEARKGDARALAALKGRHKTARDWVPGWGRDAMHGWHSWNALREFFRVGDSELTGHQLREEEIAELGEGEGFHIIMPQALI